MRRPPPAREGHPGLVRDHDRSPLIEPAPPGDRSRSP
jgi:hypothetical protein